jgi:electron transport complex protein RnfB
MNIDEIDKLLPQTQCGRCGYNGCRPYAEAVASGEADINRCPPGGAATMRALAALAGREPKPIDPECGEVPEPKVAWIREDDCIGCTRCIQACPVDAIAGAAKLMHTVIADECTGCELCLPACPVDCIEMPPAAPGEGQVRWPPRDDDEGERERAGRARRRFIARNARLEREARERQTRRERRKAALRGGGDKKAEIAAAIARAKARRVRRET